MRWRDTYCWFWSFHGVGKNIEHQLIPEEEVLLLIFFCCKLQIKCSFWFHSQCVRTLWLLWSYLIWCQHVFTELGEKRPMFAYKLFNKVTLLLNRCHWQTQTFPLTLLCLCFKALEDLHHRRCLIIPRMEVVACGVSWAACRFASSQGWWWQAQAKDDKKPPAKLGRWGLRRIFGLQCFTSSGLIHSAASFSLFLAKPNFSM